MGQPARLEEFGKPSERMRSVESEGRFTEEKRLAVFEDGYSAGWDDASAALSKEHQRLAADLAGNLADLSFTFHEARSHVLKGVEPLVRQLVENLLPKIARTTLPHLVSEKLDSLLREGASSPVAIVTSPNSLTEIEAILPSDPGFPIELREEPTLAEGQVFIRMGEIEHSIDTGAALESISVAVNDFFNLNEERLQAHG